MRVESGDGVCALRVAGEDVYLRDVMTGRDELGYGRMTYGVPLVLVRNTSLAQELLEEWVDAGDG